MSKSETEQQEAKSEEDSNTGWAWKPGGKWERDMRETYKKWVTSRQRASVCVCVCVYIYMCVCVFLSSIKVSGASYFSSAAGDVRTSSALFPALAPGEFITSPSARDCLEATRLKERRANVFCCFFLLCCLSEPDLFCFFLLLTRYDGFHTAAVTWKYYSASAIVTLFY